MVRKARSSGRKLGRRKEKIETERKVFIAFRVITAVLAVIGLVGSAVIYFNSKNAGIAITVATAVLLAWGILELTIYRKIASYLKREMKSI